MDATASGTVQAGALWFPIARGGSDSLSAQIATRLRALILDAQLRQGDRLPSSRVLAEHLGVARSLVVRAYEQLIGEGYLEARLGAETVVAAGIVIPPRSMPTRPAAPRRPSTESAMGERPIDLRAGHPFAPTEVPEHWRRAVTVAARQAPTSYAPPPLGTDALREQIAQHARRARGIACTAQDVIVTAGTVDALLLVALALGHGARIAMEDPGYPEAARVLGRAGAAIVPVGVDAEGMTMSRLREVPGRLDAVLVTPSHQYPLGGRMAAAERTALIRWAVTNGAAIVEDDYDSEFRHTGTALPAIASLDPGGTVVHIGSLNKAFSPSVRCGYIIATSNAPIWDRLTEVKGDLGSNVSLITQTATAALFASGELRRYIARTRREYRHRRALLLSRFAAHGLGDSLTATDGGLHAVFQLPEGITGAELAEELAGRGVLVESIAASARLPRPDDLIAIGYGAEPATRLARGIDEVLRAVVRHRP